MGGDCGERRVSDGGPEGARCGVLTLEVGVLTQQAVQQEGSSGTQRGLGTLQGPP